MPALGAGMDVGRLMEWYVKPGDQVHRGDIIALVETDKAEIDVEVFQDGVVEELLIDAGVKVPVGTPLARISSAVAAPAAPATSDEVAAPEAGAETIMSRSPIVAVPGGEVDEHPFVTSPLVRRQAQEAGVELTRLHGTGPAGVITRRDVSEAAVSALVPPASGGSSPYARRLAAEREVDTASLVGTGPGGVVVARDVPTDSIEHAAPAVEVQSAQPDEKAADEAHHERAADKANKEERALAMRQAIARAMERSNREIPHYYLGETVDVEDPLRWLAEVNADRPPTTRILPAVLVLKATALALQEFPDFNGYWIDDAFQPGDGIHLGVAVNLRRGGLLAPAIRDADQRSLDDLMEALKDVVQRTRAGGLRGSELTDPTITVSNLGDTGVETIQGVIIPPQVALIGVGRITERPWAVGGMLGVRRTIYVSLAGDHRASDGHRGGRFLGAIAATLARPETL